MPANRPRPVFKPSMIGSWFKPPNKSSDGKPSPSPSVKNRPVSSPPSPVEAPEPIQRTSSEPARKSDTLPVPHDAAPIGSRNDVVIPDQPDQLESGQDGRRPSKELSGTTSLAQATRSTSALPATYAYTSLNASTGTLPEPFHDPFSGAPLGILVPTQAPPTDPSVGSKDEGLWNHLGRILELQSDIAAMHVQMEGIGARAKAKSHRETRTMEQKASKGASRHWDHADHGDAAGDGPGVGDRIGVEEEGDEVADDEEAERKKAREEEFARLGDRFTGRKDAIDEIMNKLDDLSQALTTFHSLQTPSIEFPNSRSNSNSQPTPKSSVPQPAQRSRTVPSSTPYQASSSQSVNPLAASTPPASPTSTPSSRPMSPGLKYLGENPLVLNAWVPGHKNPVVDSPTSIKAKPTKDASYFYPQSKPV